MVENRRRKSYNPNEHDGVVVVRMIVSWRRLSVIVTYLLESNSAVLENEYGDCENGEDDNDCGDASVTYNAFASVCYD